jgi:hypothetical protein
MTETARLLNVHDHPIGAPLTRRRWLQVGGIGLFGLTLPRLLQADGTPRPSQPNPRARSCVLFVLHGGPSQLDLWDLKPAAPVEVRGEFHPIATTAPECRFASTCRSWPGRHIASASCGR